jgi:hypothetical protein
MQHCLKPSLGPSLHAVQIGTVSKKTRNEDPMCVFRMKLDTDST